MRMSKLVNVAVASACIGFAGGAVADDKATDHSKHDKTMTATADASHSQGSQDLHKAMMQGMQDMQKMKMTGDPDHDFASMMIEHHEQAIAMSKVQLKHGKNAEAKKKAQEIIDMSQKDIAELKKWSTDHHSSQKTAAD